MKKTKRICIDISNITPGVGGSGGGIATYTINLIKDIDRQIKDGDVIFYCLKNSKFKELDNLKNLRMIEISVNNSNIFSRLFWLNFRLPLFCVTNKITVLHRVIPELPLFKVCRYIITMHDFMFDLYLQNSHLKKYLSAGNKLKFHLFRFLSKIAVSNSSLIIVPAKTIKDELERKFSLVNNIRVINEASEKVKVPLMKAEHEQSILNIGVIAGFYPHKGHFSVLKLAAYFIKAGFNNFRIYFRGSHVYSNYVEDVKTEISKMGLDKFVSFEPFKAKISLAEIYSNYDLVLLLSEYEGFGLPVLEAQAHSIPVLCSDIPIFRENLKDSAMYLNPDFSDKEVLILIERLKDQSKMHELALAGISNVSKFSWEKMATETMNSYYSLLN